jgi:hypothetical protein
VKFGIGRYLYRLPAQWVEYDPVKKQITQLPQLPAFALPKPKADSRADLPKTVTGPTLAATDAPVPKAAAPEPAKPARLPATGPELHRRLREYDSKLMAQKQCPPGALLAHVTQAGVKAGYSANMTEWSGPAIPFAVEAVREFEQSLRANTNASLAVA